MCLIGHGSDVATRLTRRERLATSAAAKGAAPTSPRRTTREIVGARRSPRAVSETLDERSAVVIDGMDQAALSQALAAGQKLADFERQQDEDVLTAARNAFPELRRRSRVLPPVASATVAGEGEGNTAAPLPPAAHRAGWYRRRGSSSRTLKDVAPARTPWWPTDVAEVTVPAPFPAGLEVK
jgi:hypothetical protein